MKRTKLGIGLLLMLALVVTSGTFAYWASSVTGNSDSTSGSNPTVTIGSGGVVTTTVSLTANGTTGAALVPTAYGTPGTDDTATFTYNVDWTQAGTAADGATGTLAATTAWVSAGSITDGPTIEAMFTATTTADTAVTLGDTTAMVITVVFDTEPATQALYDQLQTGALLTLEITFTVTAD